MNLKVSVFALSVEAIIYLLLYNLHDYTEELTSLLNVNRKQQVSLLEFCWVLFNIIEEKTYLLVTFSSNLAYCADLTNITSNKEIYGDSYGVASFQNLITTKTDVCMPLY